MDTETQLLRHSADVCCWRAPAVIVSRIVRLSFTAQLTLRAINTGRKRHDLFVVHENFTSMTAHSCKSNISIQKSYHSDIQTVKLIISEQPFLLSRNNDFDWTLRPTRRDRTEQHSLHSHSPMPTAAAFKISACLSDAHAGRLPQA